MGTTIIRNLYTGLELSIINSPLTDPQSPNFGNLLSISIGQHFIFNSFPPPPHLTSSPQTHECSEHTGVFASLPYLLQIQTFCNCFCISYNLLRHPCKDVVWKHVIPHKKPSRLSQSVTRLTEEPEVPDSIPVPATYFVSPSADSNRAVVSYWRKYVHEVLVNRSGGLSLPRKSVARLA